MTRPTATECLAFCMALPLVAVVVAGCLLAWALGGFKRSIRH